MIILWLNGVSGPKSCISLQANADTMPSRFIFDPKWSLRSFMIPFRGSPPSSHLFCLPYSPDFLFLSRYYLCTYVRAQAIVLLYMVA